MLGLWEVGTGPQTMSLHIAFRSELTQLLEAPARLRAVGVVPLGFDGAPTEEPVVLAWMPAASVYFRDPDGNLLELLSMLECAPLTELGVISWSNWNEIQQRIREQSELPLNASSVMNCDCRKCPRPRLLHQGGWRLILLA